MELRNIVEIKRRQRIARAALPKLEGAPLRDHLTSDEAGALREVVQKDLPALVEDNKRLAGELAEVRRRFRQTDPAAYNWYFGWIGEQENRGRSRRQPGSAAGRIIIHDDFDDPLPEEMLAPLEGRKPEKEIVLEGNSRAENQEKRR